MKNKFTFFFLLISFSVSSQTTEIFPTKDGVIFYSSNQKVDTALTKDHLFTLSKMWLAYAFNDAREVIKMEDREGGIIMGKGNFVNSIKSGFGTYKTRVSFRITIKVKNGSYTIQISDLEATYNALNTDQTFTPNNTVPTKNEKNIYAWRRDTNEIIEGVIQTLYKYIQKNKSDFIKVSPDEKADN